MKLSEILDRWLPALVVVLVTIAYANHFHNEFQFDDGHAVVDNLAIRDLRNIPRMFVNGKLISALAVNQNYRPLTAASFAIDYALGGGLIPFYFHITTFFVFILQLLAMGCLFSQILPNRRQAWLAVALYGVHPVGAQTVNYICQRSEVYVAAFLCIGLYLYIRQKPGWAAVAFILAGLTKQNGLVFPALLLAYEYFLGRKSFRKTIPLVLLGFVLTVFVLKMTPKTFEIGRDSVVHYWATQPFVLMTYLKQAILPTDLVGDSDMRPFANLTTPLAVAGYFGLACVIVVAFSKRGQIGFGLSWFIISQAPTLLAPFSDVTNDHRMYVPFIGLALIAGHLASTPRRQVLLALLLPLAIFATLERNRIWATHEAFWYEVTVKSPGDGRGWMNYALSVMAQGRNEEALEALLIARPLTSEAFSPLWLNFGVIYGLLNEHDKAEAAFKKAMEVDPGTTPMYIYGNWLASRQRTAEAVVYLRKALLGNPNDPRPLSVLSAIWNNASKLAQREQRASRFTDLAMLFFLDEKYDNAIRACEHASTLDPKDPVPHNNRAACYIRLGKWIEAEQAALKALELQPDFPSAQENLTKARYHLKNKG